MSDIAKRIAGLSPEKRDLLFKHLQKQQEQPVRPHIPRLSRQTNQFPVSFMQRSMWVLNQLEPGTPVYNIFMAVRLSGPLNVSLLERSFNEIVLRHEVLRTTFSMVDGKLLQVIHPPQPVPLAQTDIRHVPADQREAEALRLVAVEAQQPVDLERGPLFRVALLRLDEQEHFLLVTMHHIISDGWSIRVFIKEIAALYEAFALGKPAALPELPIQYADFAAWQQEWLQGEVLEKQLSYWQQQLAPHPMVLDLPTDRPRPPIQDYRGAIRQFVLPKSLSEGIKALSQQAGCTLFMTLMSAFQVLLYRYSAQEHINVGIPIAGRDRPEIEDLIGFFINMLIIHGDLSGAPTFRQLLGRIREAALGAYAHQDLPFERLLEALQPERDLSRSPLFQVMFNLQNTRRPPSQIAGLSLSPLTMEQADIVATVQCDLTLAMEDDGQDILGSLLYDTTLFAEATIERMIGHFQTLLAAAVANPDTPISELPLLTSQERQQLLVEWQYPALAAPANRCIHQLFESQVERDPAAVAVVFDPGVGCKNREVQSIQLSYAELNQRANQLAHYLRRSGVEAGTRVGICMERSPDLIVSVLAVFKAGAAYVPMDPAHPTERLEFIATEAQIAVLLCQAQTHLVLPNAQFQIIDIDAVQPMLAEESPANLPPAGTSEQLAYIIYTSGSTGQAKGVMVSHRSLVDIATAWSQAYQLDASDCHLQMANFTFDVFVGDLVKALCSGARLVLCPRELLLLPQHLYELMRKHQVNCAEFVPVVLRQLQEYLQHNGQHLDFMRLLVCGSDSWTAEEYLQTRAIVGATTRVINSFGLSEATIDSSFFESDAAQLASPLVPIGRPFANTCLYILDQRGQLAPIGVPGELYVGGSGLAWGYLNRPDMTAAKFLPDPFSGLAGARLYRSGDRARYLPDGNIEFLGRTDYQIKLRGFRIELGEIEAALYKHPGVGEAVAIVREDTGDKRIVAYIVPQVQPAPSASELHRFLQGMVPAYMAPSAFVFLEALPLSSNGKIDRRALPAPDALRPEMEDTFVAPRTTAEEMVSSIWSDVLAIEQIGVYDNFFQLGGHSLLATQVVYRINEAFQIDLPLRRIFEEPTIAGLSQLIEEILIAEIEALSDEEALYLAESS